MVVGTFSDDFNGTGETFIVSGPLAVMADFESYKHANGVRSIAGHVTPTHATNHAPHRG